MTKVMSLNERVDTTKIRAGSMVIIAHDEIGYEIVQPGEPMFSMANFVAVAFVDACGSLIKLEQDTIEQDEPDSSAETKFATAIICTKMYVNCPHCDEQQDGWVGDPRGESYTCTSCKKIFSIACGCPISIQ